MTLARDRTDNGDIPRTAEDSDAVFRRSRTLPVSLVLAGSMAALVLIAVALVLVIGFWTNQRNTIDLLNQRSLLIIEYMERVVRSHLEPAVAQASYLRRRIESGVVDASDEERMTELLRGALAAAPQIEVISFWDTGFRQIVAVNDSGFGGAQTIVRDDSNSELARTKDAVARSAQGPFWDDIVFVDGPGQSYVNLVQPMMSQGRYIGFLAIAVSLPELSRFVTEVGELFDASAFILYGEDRVLAHPLLMQTHPEQSVDNPVVGIHRIGDIVLSHLWDGEKADIFEEAAESGVKVVILDVGELEYVAIYRWIEDFGTTPWALGAWFVSEDVSQELERVIFSGVAGLAIALLATVTAIWLGRRMAKPIRLFAASATQVGALEISHVNSLPGSRIRELNDQASAFNAMLSGLRWFETYVPRTLVTRLVKHGESEELESQERHLTVMFTDICGFTAESESLPAAETASFLNEHFALLGGCVDSEGGTIDKFIGDGLMAFWGAPDEQSDTALRACRAALKMMQAVAAENAKRAVEQRSPVRVRIGIHAGPVVVGNIGAPGRMNYTIVGDTVNTCQRLESLGKELDRGEPVIVLVSDSVANQVDDPAISFEPAGSFQVKGRLREIRVLRLIAA